MLIAPGKHDAGEPRRSPTGRMPCVHELLGALGIAAGTPLNLALVLALVCCVAGLGVAVAARRWGYALRTVGLNPDGRGLCRHPTRRA